MAISQGYKPDNFESHSSLKLSFTSIRGVCLYLWNVNLSLNQTLPISLLNVRQNCMTPLILAISLFEGLSPFNLKGLCCSYAWSRCLCEGRTSFCTGHKTLRILTYVFEWLCFTQSLTSFLSINHPLHLYAQFLMLFHLT